MNDFTCFQIESGYVTQNDLCYDGWKLFEECQLLQIQIDEVALIWGPLLLLADSRDWHKFALVILVHEVNKAFFVGEPVGELHILLLIEINGFSIGKAVWPSEAGFVPNSGVFGSGSATAFDFAVDDAQKIEVLLHCYKIIYKPKRFKTLFDGVS